MQTSSPLKPMIYASLFAALIVAGAQISIPIGPVPIVLQNMFVLMAALALGPKWGLASVSVYLLAGALGLPVFAGGTGGFAKFTGPTGGYLISYIPCVLITGWISELGQKKGDNTMFIDLFAAITGSLIIYLVGIPWLKVVTSLSWEKSIMVGMLPFIMADLFKAVAAAYLAMMVRSIFLKRAE